MAGLDDYFGPGDGDYGYSPPADTGGGYDPRLDPSDPSQGNYDPRLDTGMEGGGAVPQPGISLASIAGLLKNFPGGLTGLLGVLAPVLGGVYAKSQTSKANQQMQDAIKAANAQVTGTLGGNAAIYAPYQQAGLQGLQRLQALPQSNLAAQYKPLGTGAGLSLANVTGR